MPTSWAVRLKTLMLPVVKAEDTRKTGTSKPGPTVTSDSVADAETCSSSSSGRYICISNHVVATTVWSMIRNGHALSAPKLLVLTYPLADPPKSDFTQLSYRELAWS